MASTLNFWPKKSLPVWGGGEETVRDAEQTKWQVIMLIGFAFWGRNIIRERSSRSKLRERGRAREEFQLNWQQS